MSLRDDEICVLARSLWPRSGGDRANQSRVEIPGPEPGARVRHRVELPTAPTHTTQSTRSRSPSGLVIGDDGRASVTHAGTLSCVAIGAKGLERVWSRVLATFELDEDEDEFEFEFDEDELEGEEEEEDEEEDEPPAPPRTLLPTALASARTLVSQGCTVTIFDGAGEPVASVRVPLLDDSGPSHNVVDDGRRGAIVLTTMGDGVFVWAKGSLTPVNVSGYDIVPVVVYDDFSLGVSGYAGAGYCRVRLDGELMWKSGLTNADLVPTIHSLGQRAAVGSVNDNSSLIVSCAGDVLGDHDEAAVFAAYPDGGWIALSRHSIARLSATGTALWRHPIDAQLSWGAVAPLVDRHGAIFVVDGDSLVSFAPSGARALTLKLGAVFGPLAPVGPGAMAVVVDDELWWIASS